jgi:hypothetical protein
MNYGIPNPQNINSLEFERRRDGGNAFALGGKVNGIDPPEGGF